jgi:hypothetical protein
MPSATAKKAAIRNKLPSTGMSCGCETMTPPQSHQREEFLPELPAHAPPNLRHSTGCPLLLNAQRQRISSDECVADLLPS